MRGTLSIIKVFRNKYFIASAAFIGLMLFIDHNDILMQLDRRRQLNELLVNKVYYEEQIKQTQKTLDDLQNNAAALEKYAREKFYLKKDNEDLFLVTPQNSQKNQASQQ